MTTPPCTVAALALLAALVGIGGSAGTAAAADLRGSTRSMIRQHDVAVEQGYTFLRTRAQLERLADEGRLERIVGNGDYEVNEQVAYPYARPEVRLFIERLAAQYREATGERLVVTSLVRPTSEQPSNAHRLSVHPAGMALDLRVPADAASRGWLERALLGLERSGVLDVTREYHPPHYHVAIFPELYLAYVGRREAAAAKVEAEAVASQEAALPVAAPDADAAPASAAPVVTGAAGTDAGQAGGASGALALALGMGLMAIPLARRRSRARPAGTTPE